MLPSGVSAEPGVVLNDGILMFLARMRSVDPGAPMHVTSAVRPVMAQAQAMWVKYQADPSGTGLRRLYADDTAIGQIVAAAKTDGVNGIAGALAALAAKGVVLSRHMVGDAVDFSIDGLNQAQINGVVQAAKQAGAREVIVESVPPHIHAEGLTGGWLPSLPALPTLEASTKSKLLSAGVVVLLGLLTFGAVYAFRRRKTTVFAAGGSDDVAGSDGSG